MKASTTPKFLRASLLCGMLAVSGSVQAADVIKADNADDLNLTNSWVGGAVPTVADVAVWDSTVSGANSTLLATNTTWSGLRIANPGGPVTISASSTNLTLGATLTLRSAGIDLSAATANLTLSNGVATTLGYTAPMTVGSGVTLDLAGSFTRAAQSTVNFDTSAGGTIHIGSGTVSNILLYSTYNGSDVAALDGSKNVVAAGTIVNGGSGYEANTAGLPATAYVDFVNGATGTADDCDFGGSGSVYAKVFRFNTPQPNRNYWLVDTASKNNYVDPLTFLVTANVGAQDVIWTGGYNALRWNNGDELVIAQHNPAGTFYMNGATSVRGTYSGDQVTKTGVGRVIWNSPQGLPNAGATRILQGEFIMKQGTAVSPIRVYSGARFSGNGFYRGGVAVYSGGTLGTGDENGIGRLVVTNSFELAGGSTIQFYGATVPATNTEALMLYTNGAAAVNVGGTVTVDILSGTLSAGNYPLIQSDTGFSQTNFVLGLIKPHVDAYLTNLSSTTLDLVVQSVNQPLIWATGSGTWDVNSSTNWQDALAAATTYQEFNGLGDSVLFEDTLSGGSPITVTLNTAVNPSTMVVNASKHYTFSGTGSIDGGTYLTKSGSGTLSLATANSFSGGLNLNGGTTVFSAIGNLGSGAISFDGGTLQYSGNTDDISVRTVSFGAGGATLDIGASDVTFSNSVGNGGAGGLTKLGSGKLTLSGTNNYSGDTIVSAGTLALNDATSSLPNSPNIVLAGGTTFDLATSGVYTLSAAASQKLSGAGGVNGSVIVPAGTTISPATDSTVGTLTITNFATLDVSGTLILNATTTGSDLIQTDYLTVYPGTVISIPSTTLTNGSYKLIQANQSFVGPLGNITLLFSQPGKSADLELVTDGSTNMIYLQVANSASDDLTWSGVDSMWNSINSSWNLTGTATPWIFTNGSTVRFNEVGSGNPNVSLMEVLKPSLIVASNTTDYTLIDGTGLGGGKVSGGARLIKQGPGILTISTPNDNTGSTTVQAGKLAVTGALGSGPVTNNAELEFTPATPISVSSLSGTGNLTVLGGNAVTVEGTANYTGGTTISAGTLQIGNGGSAPMLSTSAVTNNGTLILNSSTDWTYSIPETGTGILWKQGTNALTVSATSSRTGQTRVESGRIILAGADQVQGPVRIENGGVMDISGNNQTFNGLSGGTYSGHLVNNAGTATNVVTINGGGDSRVVIDNNEGSGGVIAVVKNGAAEYVARSASTFTGGLTINEGTWNFRTANAQGLGPITFNGGTLGVYNGGNVGNPVFIQSTGTVTHGGANIYYNAVTTGDSNSVLNVTCSGNVFTPQSGCNLTDFHGTIALPGSGFVNFRMDGLVGGATVTYDLGTNSVLYQRYGNRTTAIGKLLGGVGSRVEGGGGGTTTWVIGGKNESGTYSGSILNVGSTVNITKEGAGTQTLAGTNAWAGITRVDGGTLALTGAEGNPTNTSSVVLNSGILDVSGLTAGTLYLANTNGVSISGSGSITGSVVVDAGVPATTIAPGASAGVLIISGGLTVPATTTFVMELNNTNSPTADRLNVGGTLSAVGATVNVTNIGPDLITGDTFQLFSGAVAGVTVNLPASNALNTVEYVWNNKIAVDGTLELVSGASPINPNPTNILYGVASGVLSLSWPDNAGWILQAQTNVLGVGLSTNWVDVAGSETLTSTNITINAASPTVFYRLRLP